VPPTQPPSGSRVERQDGPVRQDGKVARIVGCADPAEALKAVGLKE
jgi:hypothetical protein